MPTHLGSVVSSCVVVSVTLSYRVNLQYSELYFAIHNQNFKRLKDMKI